jgi:DNA polymerase-3 subunit epsilon
MRLNLKRPIIVFDLETTGINITKDRIVEIALIKVHPNGDKEEFHKIVNPGIKIPAESTAFHGITDEQVKDLPTLKDLGQEIIDFIGDADLAGYNSNKFDIPVLVEELMRNGFELDVSERKFVDIQNIFHKMEQRTLVAAYQFYCQKQLENAHSAMYDTKATLEVLEAQLNKYQDLSENVEDLAKFTNASNNELVDLAGRLARNKNGDMIYNFGKHKDKTVKDVMKIEPGYYGWMLDADFPLYTKQCLRKEMERLKEEVKVVEDGKDIHQKIDELKNKFNRK